MTDTTTLLADCLISHIKEGGSWFDDLKDKMDLYLDWVASGRKGDCPLLHTLQSTKELGEWYVMSLSSLYDRDDVWDQEDIDMKDAYHNNSYDWERIKNKLNDCLKDLLKNYVVL